MMRALRSAALRQVRLHHCDGGNASLVTKAAPDFKATAVVNGEIVPNVTLSQYKGQYVVLFFYPLDFTFVCPTEITAFNDRAAEFEALGAKVAAVSVDSEFSHLAWTKLPRNKGGLGDTQIPLIADLDKSISRNYGVLLDAGVSLRGLFVIDKEGNVRSQVVNDLPIGRSVDETLRVVQAVKYSDENGGVMPCNWTPGKPTMKPDPTGSQEFFSKNA
eukprot:TRINITY_DN3295_c0_g2_i1.p2 TRINITY_DN3295_c0_g2~~TRINITY_DN3295_c0_g2_i1.p2  ORF type:complete len:217 (+),score=104.59 TRINITY_DN3295_c0_g2_i1:55-705(+)